MIAGPMIEENKNRLSKIRTLIEELETEQLAMSAKVKLLQMKKEADAIWESISSTEDTHDSAEDLNKKLI
jgi:PleD family two-component response regulator